MLNADTIRFGDVYDVKFPTTRDGVGVDLSAATITLTAQHVPTETDYNLVATGGPGGIITHRLTGTLPKGTYDITAEIVLGGDTATAPTFGTTRLTVR
jgi:hypothetical protein